MAGASTTVPMDAVLDTMLRPTTVAQAAARPRRPSAGALASSLRSAACS